MDMVKISGQSDTIQMKVADLLVSGQCRTFKRAFAVASLDDYRSVMVIRLILIFRIVGVSRNQLCGSRKQVQNFKKFAI